MIKFIYKIYVWINRVMYNDTFYFLYKFLYFIYKHISDYDKIKIIKSKLKEDVIVLDIGANIGFYSILISNILKKKKFKGVVHSFEPDKKNFKYFIRNVKRRKNIVPNNLAVGENTGKLPLFKSDMNVDHRTYNPNGGDVKGGNYFVKSISIDDYLKSCFHINNLFVKIDVQGYDYYVLKGMLNTFKKSDSVIIFGEFWPYALNKAGVNPFLYLDLLKDNGFKVKLFGLKISEMGDKVKDKYFYTDFIAIK